MNRNNKRNFTETKGCCICDKACEGKDNKVRDPDHINDKVCPRKGLQSL